MSCEYDWEQADKAMAAELKALGIEDTIEPPTPEEIAEFERQDWEFEYEMEMQRVARCAAEHLARFCPVCGRELDEGEFWDSAPSVGIFWKGWYNECPVHGEFEVEEVL